MLKSKLHFFTNLLSFVLLVTALVLSTQEAEHYVSEEKLWVKQSWNFWK
jgi:hypothetical protein